MTRAIGLVAKWLGIGVAFAAVLAAPGCARWDGVASKQSPAPAPQPPQMAALPETEGRAPVVNVFGELDGVEAAAGPRSGEANFQQHTFVAEGADSSVSSDPSGKWLVYASTRHSEQAAIYLQRVDGLSVTQLTDDRADNAFPVFSPDGKQIAFCSTRGGNWDIYLMDRDGKNVVLVAGGPGQEIHPSFSPDGGRLVYCSLSQRSSQWELWTVNLKTNERRMIGWGLFPAWSPDKQQERIAFQRARQRGSRWFSLWTLDLVDGEARRLTEVAVSTNAALVSPSWSPDGQRLAFATIVEPARTRGGRARGQEDIWVIDADGANRRRLTEGNSTNLTPFWSVDNRIYFISDRGGSESVWSARTDAGAAVAQEVPKPSAVGAVELSE